MSLVSSIGIGDLVNKLEDGEYLIPKFQRDFVWSISDVISLINSIFSAKPIGMMTIWEQPDESTIELEHISLPGHGSKVVYFGNNDHRTSKYYAILDGRQRSTAIAMAFGGLTSPDSTFKYGGDFFLNVNSMDDSDRVIFLKANEIKKKGYENLAKCIADGLLPLKWDKCKYQTIERQWMKYIELISDPQFYDSNNRTSGDDVRRRVKILQSSFEGLIETSLAIYTVPQKYDLGTICDIFETLNTTGTKVSTVDLIHSMLYSKTISEDGSPILLREWISELGEEDGAIGWANVNKRPELIAQISTACYVSQLKKGGVRASEAISTVKSSDLLRTPVTHWKNFTSNKGMIASYMKDFQACVAGNAFSMNDCPYPVTIAIYTSLRWTDYVDGRGWDKKEIDLLFRPFFWRNALTSRYDQGFLTKLGSDINYLISCLEERKNFQNPTEWLDKIEKSFNREFGECIPSKNLVSGLLDARPTGALAKAFRLIIRTTPNYDILSPSENIKSPRNDVDLHHIYPKKWIRSNITKQIQNSWAEDGIGGVNCIANLTPLSRKSNMLWREDLPWKIFRERGVSYEKMESIFASHFINKEAYNILVKQSPNNDDITRFWKERAFTIAETLSNFTKLSFTG